MDYSARQNILVYVPKITVRVRYTFKLFLTELLGIKFQLTDDPAAIIAHDGPKFSYAFHPVGSELFIAAKSLLFEMGIRDYEISCGTHKGEPVIFNTGKYSALPYDPFAATFYMVSRYEEYLPTINDQHKRFEAHLCLAFEKGFLRKPVVNIWSLQFRELLSGFFPNLIFEEKKYQYISSIDIDNAWAYKQKGFLRTSAALARCFLGLNFSEFSHRIKVLTGLETDPYDTYAYQLEVQKRYQVKSLYFILFAEYGLNDKNVPVYNQRFQELIKSLSDVAPVGIHPSYQSNTHHELLHVEINRLAKVLNREISMSRQHFLKLELPGTYNRLIDLGITDDYTMGFASEIGFRAGICSSFNFFDLDLEAETKLKIHPFQVMDASLKFYMQINPEHAMNHIKPLIDEIKKVNGTFISLWHNESLSNMKPWEGWQSVYEEMVMEATS